MGKGKSDRLFQKNRRYRAVDEKRQYRARRIGSGRRVPADDLIQPNFRANGCQRRAYGLVAALARRGLCVSHYDCSQAPHPNAARLYYDFSLSKEGQEMLRGMQRIPVRKDVEPNPPRLFRGYKRVVENPEDYTDFEGLIRLYNDIFKLR